MNNLAIVLAEMGRHPEALAACRDALAHKPDLAATHYNLGNIHRDLGELDEAASAYRTALAIKTDFAIAGNNLAMVLKDQGDVASAIDLLRQTLAHAPLYVSAHDNLLLFLHYHSDNTPQTLLAEHRAWNARHAAPLKRTTRHTNDRDPDRRLRIGYVSSDFYNHASACFLIPLLSNHDPSEVEIVCYADVAHTDDLTRRFESIAEVWRDTHALSDEQLASRVMEDRIDVLVDLKLHTTGNRLLVFARKPAPVQVTWLGCPTTTGMDAIDYRLTDPWLDPPGSDGHYVEQSIRLPDCFWCYDPLVRDLPTAAAPALSNGYATFGCLNQLGKLTPPMLDTWGRLLANLPGARLLLLTPPGTARTRVLDDLQSYGVDADRVDFVWRMSRPDYLRAYSRIDISLDTFPYNGHTTSLDSLWMGVPIVTLTGQTAVSRAGGSLLSNLGLQDLVADTPQRYIEIAMQLAAGLPRLESLHHTLRPRMESSPLMDGPRFARNIEAAYRTMWQRWCTQGLR